MDVEETYDALDRLVEEKDFASGGTIDERYVWDGESLLAVLDSDDNVTERELNGPNVNQVFATEMVGGENPGVNWELTDAQQSTRDVVRATVSDGVITAVTVVDHLNYNAFGLLASPQSTTDPQLQTRMMFTGLRFDAVSGLYFADFRIYDPGTGTWIKPDPAGFGAGDTNLYRYCGSNPTNYVDPSGMAPPQIHLDPSANVTSSILSFSSERLYDPTKDLVITNENSNGLVYDETARARLFYEPYLWNSDSAIKSSNNCYSYALNRPLGSDERRRLPGRPQPGTGMFLKGCDINKEALNDSYGVKPLPANGVVPPGYHKIQGFYDPSARGDYHWYRQDSDGTWSSKHGNGDVDNVDASGPGHIITDPAHANNNYGPSRNYSQALPVLIAPN